MSDASVLAVLRLVLPKAEDRPVRKADREVETQLGEPERMAWVAERLRDGRFLRVENLAPIVDEPWRSVVRFALGRETQLVLTSPLRVVPPEARGAPRALMEACYACLGRDAAVAPKTLEIQRALLRALALALLPDRATEARFPVTRHPQVAPLHFFPMLDSASEACLPDLGEILDRAYGYSRECGDAGLAIQRWWEARTRRQLAAAASALAAPRAPPPVAPVAPVMPVAPVVPAALGGLAAPVVAVGPSPRGPALAGDTALGPRARALLEEILADALGAGLDADAPDRYRLSLKRLDERDRRGLERLSDALGWLFPRG